MYDPHKINVLTQIILLCIVFSFCLFLSHLNFRYLGPRVMQKYEIRDEMIKVLPLNFKLKKYLRLTYRETWLIFDMKVVRIGKEGTEAVEVKFILALSI